MTTLMPNTFQHPNMYIDSLDHLLLPSETKVLNKAVREILGFWDNISSRSARIALSVFVDGKFKKGKPRTEENRLCHGCGLSEKSIRTALASLNKYNVLVKVGSPTNDGQMFTLQLDPKKIDWNGLEERKAGKQDTYEGREDNFEGGVPKITTPPNEPWGVPKITTQGVPKITTKETQGKPRHEEEERNGVKNFTNGLDDPEEFQEYRVTDFFAPIYVDTEERSTFGNITKKMYRVNPLFVEIAGKLNGLHGFSINEHEEFHRYVVQPARDIPGWSDWCVWMAENNAKGKGWSTFRDWLVTGMSRDGDGNRVATYNSDFERWGRGEFKPKDKIPYGAPPQAKDKANSKDDGLESNFRGW